MYRIRSRLNPCCWPFQRSSKSLHRSLCPSVCPVRPTVGEPPSSIPLAAILPSYGQFSPLIQPDRRGHSRLASAFRLPLSASSIDSNASDEFSLAHTRLVN